MKENLPPSTALEPPPHPRACTPCAGRLPTAKAKRAPVCAPGLCLAHGRFPVNTCPPVSATSRPSSGRVTLASQASRSQALSTPPPPTRLFTGLWKSGQRGHKLSEPRLGSLCRAGCGSCPPSPLYPVPPAAQMGPGLQLSPDSPRPGGQGGTPVWKLTLEARAGGWSTGALPDGPPLTPWPRKSPPQPRAAPPRTLSLWG